MANALYKKYQQAVIAPSTESTIDLAANNIKCALVRGYTPNLSTHQFLSDVTGAGGGTIVSRTANLTTKVVALGIFGADPTVFTAVTAGAACSSIVIYKDTGVDSTSPLIMLIQDYTGLPTTPAGGDIDLVFATTGNLIFQI